MSQPTNNNVLATMVHRGPWQIPTAVQNVLCPDGTRRYARTAVTADTFFSLPASVQVTHNGKRYTVSGYVTGIVTNGQLDYAFVPYTFKANAKIVGWLALPTSDVA